MPREAPKPAKMTLTLIALDQPTPAFAAMFTRNALPGAPIIVGRQRLHEPTLGAVIVNNKVSNVCAPDGVAASEKICARLANLLNLTPGQILPSSTGVIGWGLPVDAIIDALPLTSATLTNESILPAAEGIVTTDLYPKIRRANVGAGSIVGIAKGAGMIEPNMATMLAFVCTDAVADPAFLKTALKASSDQSFNCVSVDGDMSTNDTVILMASGVAQVQVGPGAPAELTRLFQEALDRVCFSLAEKIVGDGEKITKVVSVEVAGARNRADAEKIARAIGNSLLVKSSWFGEDPNWGRLADAAGYARTGLDETKLDIHYEDVPAVIGGRPLPENKPKWKEVVKARQFRVRLHLHLGEAQFRLLASDLTDGYVNYNKSE